MEKRKGKCIKIATIHEAGLPDRMILLPYNKIYFGELKTTKEAMKKLQKYRKMQLEKLGFLVLKFDTKAGICSFLEQYDSGEI